jgi:hypothetical protein
MYTKIYAHTRVVYLITNTSSWLSSYCDTRCRRGKFWTHLAACKLRIPQECCYLLLIPRINTSSIYRCTHAKEPKPESQPYGSSSSSLGATALREPWPPLLFASTRLYPELSFSILQSPSLVGPLERHLAI